MIHIQANSNMLTDQLFTRKTITKKAIKEKTSLFKKINKINGLLSRWTKKKERKIAKIRTTLQKKINREYYEQL